MMLTFSMCRCKIVNQETKLIRLYTKNTSRVITAALLR